MSVRPEKQSIVAEIQHQLAGSSYVLVMNYMGLSVGKLADLRGRLRAAGGRVQIVANSFFKHAASQMGWSGVDGMLAGPTAIVTGGKEMTQTARILRDFVRENNVASIKGGMLGTQALTPADVDALATMPPREVLLARVVGTIAAPMSQLVGVFQQKVASLVYVLKAVEEKKGKA